MSQKILHKRSNVVTDEQPKLPTADQLDYGELAINYADGSETISIKNSTNEIVSFKSQEYIDNNDLFTTGTGKYSIVRKNGGNSTATSMYAIAEGYNVDASGSYSHAEGYKTTASGDYGSHVEGDSAQASGAVSHAEGHNTNATKYAAHAEGEKTTASGLYAHAEGDKTTASGDDSHAEGSTTTASGRHSHAEGGGTIAIGEGSHAEGYYTTASGDYGSHAEGYYTTASGDYGSHAEGMYNVASALSIHSVGIGSDTERKNAEDICSNNGYKYLIDVGGYDGTNLTVTSDGTESINPDIKSVQEILNKLVEKAGGLSALF